MIITDKIKLTFKMESHSPTESQEIFQGRWNKEEHEKFLIGIMVYGKDWKQVQKVVKTRTGPQVRSHAQKFFVKLNKINKQRKKGKNWELIQPSDIQREILEHFTEQDITPNTPIQISTLIRKDWNEVATFYKEKKKQTKYQKQLSSKKANNDDISASKSKEKEQGQISSVRNSGQQDQDQSYFIKIIKMNKKHFISGHDFKQLIDFKQIHKNYHEENQNIIGMENKRKRSFALPDEEENQTKLRQTLNNLHLQLGYTQ